MYVSSEQHDFLVAYTATGVVGYWQYVWSTPGPRSDGYTRLALVPRISYYSTFYSVASFSGEIQLKNEVSF